MKLRTNSKGLKGTIRVPGDKSISHRSIILEVSAKGETKVYDILRGRRCAFYHPGVSRLGSFIQDDGMWIRIQGVGFQGLQAPTSPLDMGNSGTSIRLISGVLAGPGFCSDHGRRRQSFKRPMDRVAIPLRQDGGRDYWSGEIAIAHLYMKRDPSASTHSLPFASGIGPSQVCSHFAALQAEGESTIIEKEKTRDHTEDMIRQFGGRSKWMENHPHPRWTRVPRSNSHRSWRYFQCSLLVSGWPHSKL